MTCLIRDRVGTVGDVSIFLPAVYWRHFDIVLVAVSVSRTVTL